MPWGTRLISPIVTHGWLHPVGVQVPRPLCPSDPAQVGPWTLALCPPQDSLTGSWEESHQIPPNTPTLTGEQGSPETPPSPYTYRNSEYYALCVMFGVCFWHCQGLPGDMTHGSQCPHASQCSCGSQCQGQEPAWNLWEGASTSPIHPAPGSQKARGCNNLVEQDLRKQNEFFRLEINRNKKWGLCCQW